MLFRSIHEKGLAPDIDVPMGEDEEAAVQLRRMPGGKASVEDALKGFDAGRRQSIRELVEGAVAKLQVEMPAAASVGGALLGMLGALAPTVKSLGLDQQIVGLIRQAGVDTAMRDTVIRGITRYLEENGTHLMEVAVNAVIGKLTRA